MGFSPQNKNFLLQQGFHPSGIYCQKSIFIFFTSLTNFLTIFWALRPAIIFFLIFLAIYFIFVETRKWVTTLYLAYKKHKNKWKLPSAQSQNCWDVQVSGRRLVPNGVNAAAGYFLPPRFLTKQPLQNISFFWPCTQLHECCDWTCAVTKQPFYEFMAILKNQITINLGNSF